MNRNHDRIHSFCGPLQVRGGRIDLVGGADDLSIVESLTGRLVVRHCLGPRVRQCSGRRAAARGRGIAHQVVAMDLKRGEVHVGQILTCGVQVVVDGV